MTNSPIPINENYEPYNQISDNLGIIQYSIYSGDNEEKELSRSQFNNISNSNDNKNGHSKPFLNNIKVERTSILTGPTADTNKNDKKKEKNKRGRKRKNSNELGEHNKYSYDNTLSSI